MWALMSIPTFDASTRKGESLSAGPWIAWLILFFSFAPAFWISSSPRPRAAWIRVLALAVETGCVVGMTAIYQGYLVGFLLIIVSWQVALVLPVQAAIVWAITDSAVWIFFQEPHYHLGWRWSATGAVLGLQGFAIVTAAIARSEASAREEQASINADLVSTRELLRESSKAGERIRIARELHDVVGHNLTAVCLHLESALHISGEPLQATLEKALFMARQLLREVRTVVSGFHDSDRIDLRLAFEALQHNIPRIALTIQIPDDLAITDAARAHAVVRCVQEITTNSLKHSDSKNLDIHIYVRDGAIEIEAHDDGSKVERKKSGTGISTMRQRLEELGGGLEIDRASQTGFHLKAWLPAGNGMEMQ
jgi:signal transduction histidine kinase